MSYPSVLRTSLLLAFATVLLAGCSTSFAPSYDPEQAGLGAVSGIVHGGQQPINGAHIYALQSSTTGYGAASKALTFRIALPATPSSRIPSATM